MSPQIRPRAPAGPSAGRRGRRTPAPCRHRDPRAAARRAPPSRAPRAPRRSPSRSHLIGGPCDEDRPLERIGHAAADAVGRRGQQRAARRSSASVAGIEQQEAAGSVGGFRHARGEARLADERGLLVARDAGDGNGTAEERRPRVAPYSVLLSRTSGSSARGTRNSRSSSSSQRCAWISNSSVREALVTSVACTRPPVSRHSRKVSMVPKASSPRSARSRAPATGDRASTPPWWRRSTDRAAARSWRAPAASAPGAVSRAHSSAVRRSCQTMARCSGTAAGALPDDRRLALIGDAERGDAPRARRGSAAMTSRTRRERVAPDVLGVVLDPAGSGVVLWQLAPCAGRRTGAAVEGDGPRRCGALVDGEYVAGPAHGCTDSPVCNKPVRSSPPDGFHPRVMLLHHKTRRRALLVRRDSRAGGSAPLEYPSASSPIPFSDGAIQFLDFQRRGKV